MSIRRRIIKSHIEKITYQHRHDGSFYGTVVVYVPEEYKETLKDINFYSSSKIKFVFNDYNPVITVKIEPEPLPSKIYRNFSGEFAILGFLVGAAVALIVMALTNT